MNADRASSHFRHFLAHRVLARQFQPHYPQFFRLDHVALPGLARRRITRGFGCLRISKLCGCSRNNSLCQRPLDVRWWLLGASSDPQCLLEVRFPLLGLSSLRVSGHVGQRVQYKSLRVRPCTGAERLLMPICECFAGSVQDCWRGGRREVRLCIGPPKTVGWDHGGYYLWIQARRLVSECSPQNVIVCSRMLPTPPRIKDAAKAEDWSKIVKTEAGLDGN